MPKQIIDLDVRDILRAKQEPFELIMSTVEKLGEQDVLQLHATFKPEPLLRVLGRQKLKSIVLEKESDHFIVQFYKDARELPLFHLDNRGLEPPQPMVRTLELLESEAIFQNGEAGVQIWNDRVPAFLLPELDALGFAYQIEENEEDGSARVTIWKE